MKLPEYHGSEATEEFLLLINNIFDLFNSRKKYSQSFYSMKDAMSDRNKHVWGPVLKNTLEYIQGLKITNGTSILKDTGKTGFLGIICNRYSCNYCNL